MHVVHMRCPLSAPSFCAIGTRRSSRTRMAACHISLVHTKSVSPIVVCRSSVTAFALAFSAVQISMVDRGLCCAHHSRTLSLASSHITAFFSSDSFSSWGFLLNRHLSFLTLAIVSSSSTNMLRESRTPPGCSKVGICALPSPEVGAACFSVTIRLGNVMEHCSIC